MEVTNYFNNNKTYTYSGWGENTDLSVGFSLLYYVISGEGYYSEGGQKKRFKEGHLYLTPVYTPFSVKDNPHDRMFHTYTHVYTQPEVKELIEVEVKKGTPLYDAVSLWRKYIHTDNREVLTQIIQLILASIESNTVRENGLAARIKEHLDSIMPAAFSMDKLCKEMGYAREYLTRVFTSEYRLTPCQYLTGRRMAYALSLLVEGKTVSETSSLCGYSSPYAFGKAFKRHYGLSPGNYLKSILTIE
jgi:AraC-like DNA-binding protein